MGNIKVVFFDMDGTLLDAHSRVSRYSAGQIREFYEQGLRFGIASGRPVSAIKQRLEEGHVLEFFSYAVGMNGSHIVTLNSEVIDEVTFMPAEGIAELIDLYADMLEAAISLSNEHTLHMQKDGPLMEALCRGDGLEKVVSDFSLERTMAWPKLAIWFKPADKEKIWKRYTEGFRNPTMKGQFAGPYSLEFTLAGQDKGEGIRRLMEMADISIQDVMGIGDSGNDLSMLRAVGTPVAMMNAEDAVRHVCRYITRFDYKHDGAVRYMKDHSELFCLRRK